MAAAYVRDSGTQTASTASSDTYVWATNPAIGNHVLYAGSAYTGGADGQTDTVEDNQGNTYAPSVSVSSPNDAESGVSIFSGKITASSGSWTTTVTWPASGNLSWSLSEYSGLAATSWLDRTGTNGGPPTTDASVGASAQNTQATGLAFAATVLAINDSSLNVSAPATDYTQVSVVNSGSGPNQGHEAAYKVLNSVETSTAAWTHDNASLWGWAAVIATYKAAVVLALSADVQETMSVIDASVSELFIIGLTATASEMVY